MQDTIVARATAPGISAVSLLRISGPRTLEVCSKLCGRGSEKFHPRKAVLIKIRDGNEILDEALITFFKGPASYTGEDTAEISLHGSEYISGRVIQAILGLGVRLAEAGEFTFRAYLNGKLDLAQAEAVADLIAARSSAEHHLALNQMKGGISNSIKTMRARILELAALVELELDFGEEDVEFADREQLKRMIDELESGILQMAGSFETGSAIKEGIPVAIVGKPNAGKSTLLNALLGEERAIVTDIPGTTRDTIEEVITVHGVRFRLVDTAGIREADNEVERIGIERTWKMMSKARLVLLLFDSSSSDGFPEQEIEKLRNETEAEIWPVANKWDMASENFILPGDTIKISAKKCEIKELASKLESFAKEMASHATDTTISNLRHFEVLKSALLKINEVKKAMENGLSGDMLAHHLRSAMQELGKITGEIDSEEVLGQIFSKFCIGK